MQWTGANNVQDGVIIDLGLMSGIKYNSETKIASLLPGGRWTDAYADIEKT